MHRAARPRAGAVLRRSVRRLAARTLLPPAQDSSTPTEVAILTSRKSTGVRSGSYRGGLPGWPAIARWPEHTGGHAAWRALISSQATAKRRALSRTVAGVALAENSAEPRPKPSAPAST